MHLADFTPRQDVIYYPCTPVLSAFLDSACRQLQGRLATVLGIRKLQSLLGILSLLTLISAGAADPDSTDLVDLSLEQLSDIQVTSVSRHPESLQKAAASIYVISSEDIRRSGATTLPEALRLAPNLEVAQVNASQYAISARGFNNAIGNKLLVLIDGRTVYTPLFSGVLWDAQDVMLEDVDRIEIISGPGAALWGANAVNGVINVITRSAAETQGGLATVGAGNQAAASGVRYGGTLDSGGNYRVYAKGFEQFNTATSTGAPVSDRFDRGQAGFRADWGGAIPSMTVQGDIYSGVSESDPAGKPTLSGMNLLGRWTRQLAAGGSFNIQSYYDHTERNDPFTFGDIDDTFDIEFQHGFTFATNHRILWGGGYRFTHDATQTNFNTQNLLPEVFLPASLNLNWKNIFAQDEVALSPKLNLTVGAKVETNIYTGAEFLPSVRLAWSPADNHMIWGAVSRAVRAPARLDTDFNLYLQLPHRPLIPVIEGGPNFQSEVANVVELGYRAQLTSAVSYSISLFDAFYDKLRSGQPPPAFIQNMISGETRGVETWGDYQVTSYWKLSAGLSQLKEQLGIDPGSTDPTGPSALGNDPAQQWSLRSAFNLPDKNEIDVAVRHVSALPNPVVPAYTVADVRFGWWINRNAQLSLALENLFNPGHIEVGPLATASEIKPSAFVKLLWRTDPVPK